MLLLNIFFISLYTCKTFFSILKCGSRYGGKVVNDSVVGEIKEESQNQAGDNTELIGVVNNTEVIEPGYVATQNICQETGKVGEKKQKPPPKIEDAGETEGDIYNAQLIKQLTTYLETLLLSDLTQLSLIENQINA